MQKKIKGSYRCIGLCVGILSLAYFLNSALEQISSFPPLSWGLKSCLSFIGATTFSALVTLIGGYAWILLLRTCGESVMSVDALLIFALAQFAKYIPGNVAHHAGRIALASKRGFTLSRVIFTMSLETTGLIIAAFILAMGWCFFRGQNLFNYSQGFPTVFQLVLAIAIAFALIIGWILFRWCPGSVRKLFDRMDVNAPSPLMLLNCLLIYLLCFFFMGVASDILAQGLFGVAESHIGLLTGTFAIAWVAGFLAIGAPAGLGVREAILLEVIGPTYGTGVAVGIAISLRAVTTFSDGLIFIVSLIAKRKLFNIPVI